MKLSKLKTIIDAVENLLDENVPVVIYTGREGNDQYTHAKAKFDKDSKGNIMLVIVEDYS